MSSSRNASYQSPPIALLLGGLVDRADVEAITLRELVGQRGALQQLDRGALAGRDPLGFAEALLPVHHGALTSRDAEM